MNAIAPDALSPALPRRAQRGTLAHWGEAIVALGWIPWKWAGLIGLFGTMLECALVMGERRPTVPVSAMVPICVAIAIGWSVQVTLGLCAWAIVDRSDAAPDRRPRRLATGLLAAVLLQAVLVPALNGLAVGRLDPCVFHGCEDKDWSKVPSWLMYSEGTGRMLIFGSLIFAWLEVHRRNRETEQRLLASQQERARLQRSAFDARLTTMRAQVDPQFLFDSLADVQAAYASTGARGAATLDCLIAYLRAALPGLRTEGSTLGAEAELVDAWLAVMAARRADAPSRRIEVGPRCANVAFPAAVLLPLVQWCLDGAWAAGGAVTLCAEGCAPAPSGRFQARLRVTPARAGRDDEPALRGIRERLQAMYGDAASLVCATVEAAPGKLATEITLSWTDEGPDRDRR
jgi:hypothetical protein